MRPPFRWGYRWTRYFHWPSFRRYREGYRVTSSKAEPGWVVDSYIGGGFMSKGCPIYVGYYGWWTIEIKLGWFRFWWHSCNRQFRTPHCPD